MSAPLRSLSLTSLWSRAESRGFGWRSLVLVLAGFVALLATNGVSLWTAGVLSEQTAAVEHTREVRRALDRTERGIVDAVTAQRGYLLTGDTDFVADVEMAAAATAETYQSLRELIRDNPDQLARLEATRPLIDERLEITHQIVRDAREGRFTQALAVLRSGRGAVLLELIQAEFYEIDQVEQALLAERQRSASRARQANAWFSILGTVLIVVVAGLAIFQFSRNFSVIAQARAELDAANHDLERRVQARTADLVAANEEVQRFAYIVSHDLRAPLVNVMGYTSELQAAAKAFERQLAAVEEKAPELTQPDALMAVREDVPEAIGFIRTSTEKMDRLINAILKLSREGRRNLAPQALNMTDLIQSIADSVNHQAESLGAEIIVEPLPEITSDRLMVEQIFGNLIDNATKYLAPDRPGEIVVRGRETVDGRVRFEVQDNGRGIAEKDHERIFELFRRSGKQDQPGEGLGLAFVRNSVRRLGGVISVSSSLGHGSTFELNFPKRLSAGDGENL